MFNHGNIILYDDVLVSRSVLIMIDIDVLPVPYVIVWSIALCLISRFPTTSRLRVPLH